MAQHGFQLRGSHGILQVDGRYQNMNVTMKESIVAPGGYSVNNSYMRKGCVTTLKMPLPPTTTIMAVDSDNWVRMDDGNIEQEAGAGTANITVYGFGTDQRKWFDSKFGLSVRNEIGQEVYNSNWAVMKVVNFFNLGFIKNWRFKIPPGKKYAAVVNGGRVAYEMGGYDGTGMWHEFRRNGDTIEIRYNEDAMWWFRDDDEFSFVAQDIDLSVIIIDVTGY
ncbi:hypothetical protein KWH75_06670 [Morganella morganii]|uniref:hypothetical protein n=1 Tax=Morganella morganii TaxID=582 RepID=UPI0021D3CDC7|nr:hypothetical protein [Morganella morganii]MCU6236751.1 hypothetical protein [Morganella morganii]